MSGTNSDGVWAQQDGTVNVKNSNIITNNDSTHAVAAQGGQVTISDTDITTHGVYARGLFVDNGAIQAERVRITTEGDQSHGAQVATGQLDLIDSSITTAGLAAVGVYNFGGNVNVTGTVIETSGQSSDGIKAQGGTTSLVNSSIVTQGQEAYGARVTNGAVVSLTGSQVKTAGWHAYGVATVGTGTMASLDNTSVETTGEGAHALFALDASTITVKDSVLRTSGDGAAGVRSKASAITIDNTLVETSGIEADGLSVNAGGTIVATRSSITTTGATSHGVNMGAPATGGGYGSAEFVDTVIKAEGTGSNAIRANSDSGSTNIVNATNSVFQADQAVAIEVESGNFDGRFDGSTVSGAQGLMNVADGANGTISASGGSALEGDVVVGSGATGSVSLADASMWQGAIFNGTGVSVDTSSYWKMTGSSDVDALVNDGMIAFAPEGGYKTLNAGTLNMNGGSFLLNTKLNEGGAASETDKVVVEGDATGDGKIFINNMGGTGAYTGTGATDGIQVVQFGGASDAQFELGAAAVVGIYDYQLVQADGQNWYLQTEGNDPVDPDPGCEETGTCPPGGHIVDIVPGYNIALSAAQNHVLTTLDTFHERVGELRSEEMEDGFHAWMRGIGKTGSYSPKSITGYNGHGFDMTTGGVQIGGDYSLGGVIIPGDKLTFGIFGEYANSSFDVRGRTADGSISSKGLGGYVTWQQKAPTDRKPGTGAYVDAVVKHDWLDFGVNAKSVSGFDLQNGYKGKATSASIEAGYGFDLGNDVVLQPQAQLTYSKIKADSFTDNYGIAVHGQEAESLIGRVGVRLEKTFYFGDEEEALEAAPLPMAKPQKSINGKKGAMVKTAIAPLPEAPKKKKFVKSVTTFVDANAKHEFKGKNGLVASDTVIGSDMSGTRYDVGAGVVARVSENVSLYGRGAIEFGGSTNVAGKVSGGLKITW